MGLGAIRSAASSPCPPLHLVVPRAAAARPSPPLPPEGTRWKKEAEPNGATKTWLRLPFENREVLHRRLHTWSRCDFHRHGALKNARARGLSPGAGWNVKSEFTLSGARQTRDDGDGVGLLTKPTPKTRYILLLAHSPLTSAPLHLLPPSPSALRLVLRRRRHEINSPAPNVAGLRFSRRRPSHVPQRESIGVKCGKDIERFAGGRLTADGDGEDSGLPTRQPCGRRERGAGADAAASLQSRTQITQPLHDEIPTYNYKQQDIFLIQI